MKIIEIGGHNEICGGYSYDYEITFGKYGNTLKDILKEIKEYSYEHSFGRLGDFGNPEIAIEGKYWGIYVNNEIYISGWAGENKNNTKRSLWKTFYESDESEVVASIRGDDGWYCGINIYITTNPKPYKYTDNDFELDMPHYENLSWKGADDGNK